MMFSYYIVFIMKLPFEGVMFFIMGCIMGLPFVIGKGSRVLFKKRKGKKRFFFPGDDIVLYKFCML